MVFRVARVPVPDKVYVFMRSSIVAEKLVGLLEASRVEENIASTSNCCDVKAVTNFEEVYFNLPVEETNEIPIVPKELRSEEVLRVVPFASVNEVYCFETVVRS